MIRTQSDTDVMQFCFMSGRGSSDAIFILWQVHEKYLGKHIDFYFAFLEQEKTFDCVSRKVLWWAIFWKTKEALCANVGKTKIMVSVHNTHKLVEASKFPCRVCNKGVGSNSIKCLVCGFWVLKCCSKVKGHLKPSPDFKCKKCRDEISNETFTEIDPVDINGEEIEKVRPFWFTDLHGRTLESLCQSLLTVVFLWKYVVMPTMHVCIVSYCMSIKHGLQHKKISPVSIAMIWWWQDGYAPWSLQTRYQQMN